MKTKYARQIRRGVETAMLWHGRGSKLSWAHHTCKGHDLRGLSMIAFYNVLFHSLPNARINRGRQHP